MGSRPIPSLEVCTVITSKVMSRAELCHCSCKKLFLCYTLSMTKDTRYIHTCPTQLPCVACQRNETRRTRYANEPAFKAKLIKKAANRIVAKYAADPTYREGVKTKALARHHATYVPKPRVPKPRKPRKRLPNARKMAPEWRVMVIGFLVERDGWSCHLCGELVTWETASIEHVTPCAVRVDHSPSNLALAHRVCNYKNNGKKRSISIALEVIGP